MKGVPVGSQIQAVFSSPMDPFTINKDTFVVGGVTGSVVYQDQTATFKPDSPFETGKRYDVILTTGMKDMDGISLPSNFTWFFETEGDLELSVTTTIPGEGATAVAPNAPILVVFSKPINRATINTDTLLVSGGVKGTVEYREETQTAVFLPSPNLAFSTEYSVTVTRGVQDLAGKPLAEEKKWSFKTAIGLDRVPPTIREKSPTDGAEEVPVTADVSLIFNEDIDGESLSSKFVLIGPEGPVRADLLYNAGNRTATLLPVLPLKEGTSYQAVLKKGVKDLSKNAMTSDVKWSFTTAGTLDRTAPQIEGRYPEVGARVPVKSAITVQFSEPMNVNTVVKENFTIRSPGGPVSGLVEYHPALRTATFQPAGPRLDYRTSYTVLLNEKIKDLAGNALVPQSWSWTTVDPPLVISHSPEIGIAPASSTFQVTFSRPIRQASINPENFHLVRLPGKETIPGAITYLYHPGDPTHPIEAKLTPSAPLAAGNVYQLTLTSSVEDSDGNPLESSLTWSYFILPP
jgi:hypothetical protein